ncbi:MAG: HipA N-terminal domain-containing protein, partial [Christensenellales bacterium]
MEIEKVGKLIVKYNGKVVGCLAELKDKRIAFQYNKEWIESGFSISPFSLPLTSDVFISEKECFGGLFGVFWDSLPDGWGELLVRRKLSSMGLNFDKLSALQKLSIIGKNGLGALEYEPSSELQVASAGCDLDEVAKEVEKILND